MKPSRNYYVYFMANKTNVALYIGVTNDLIRRVNEHKNKIHKGFTAKYDINKLVYYEVSDDPESAILREKCLKGSSRARKNKLVNSMNPEWKDLYEEIL
jgi:putative endonuclease